METKTLSRVQVIKAALSKEFGFKNVSVAKGKGTAGGWVYVTVQGLKDITVQKAHDRIEEISKAAIVEAGLKLNTYYSDDGFGGSIDCLLIQVRS